MSNYAVSIADKANIKLDKELVRRGALLHDIGRCRTHGILHAVEGGRIIRKEGLKENLARIAERHIGAGITKEEAEELGLPAGEYCPKTPEEKIVAYADNLTRGARIISFEESIEKFREILGETHPSLKRMEELHREIQSWMAQ